MALTQLKTSGIADDAVTTDKLANAINTERTGKLGNTVEDTSPQLGGNLDAGSHSIVFDDNSKVKLGNDNDLEIYHDGSDSYIKDAGTGRLMLLSNTFQVNSADNSEIQISAVENGAVSLYNNGTKKFETTSGGAEVFGELQMDDANSHIKIPDNARIDIGTGPDLKIYHDGSGGHSYIKNETGDLFIQCTGGTSDDIIIEATDNIFLKVAGSEAGVYINGDAGVELYNDNSKTVWTHGSGVNFKGGNTSDQTELQIYGNEGQDASILLASDDGDDNADNWRMYAQASDHSFALKNYAGGAYENSIVAHGNGAVELYHDNSKKFETYANGCTVSGNLNASNVDLGDNAQARFGTDNDGFIKHTGSDLFVENGTGGLNIKCTSGTGVGEGVITFSGGAGSSEHMRLSNLGDLLINQTSTTDSRLSIKQRSSAVDFINCRDTSDTLKFYVHSSGNTYNTNGNYSQISDQSLKENIVDAKSQWNDIKNIKIRNFNFTKASGMDTHTQIGCVAQEVEKVSPKLVTAPRSDGIKTVANSILYMKAIKALQEAMAKIETLETKVAALEAA